MEHGLVPTRVLEDRIDAMFRELGRPSVVAEPSPREILRRLQAGEIDVDEAEGLLKAW